MAIVKFTYSALRMKTLKERIKTQRKSVSHSNSTRAMVLLGPLDRRARTTTSTHFLSMRTSKNVGLQTLCACSVLKTRTGSRPRPPI